MDVRVAVFVGWGGEDYKGVKRLDITVPMDTHTHTHTLHTHKNTHMSNTHRTNKETKHAQTTTPNVQNATHGTAAAGS